MQQYLDLLARVLEEGVDRGDRTGTGTRAVFGHQMRFDLSAGFPLLTTKKLHTRSIFHELLWFIKGLALGEDAADPEEAPAAAESPPPEVGSRWAKEMGTRKGREAKKKQGIAGLLEVAKIQKRQSEEKLRIVQKMAEAAREAKAKSRTPSPERRSRTPSPVPLAQRLREASKGVVATRAPSRGCSPPLARGAWCPLSAPARTPLRLRAPPAPPRASMAPRSRRWSSSGSG